MKRGLIILLIIGVLSSQLVSAETTFFEGDLGYRDDFIMTPIPEGGIIDSSALEETIETFVGGGGFYIRKNESETLACSLIGKSLKKHVERKRNIDFDEKEIEIILTEINQEIRIGLSSEDLKFILDNYEDTCDDYYPLLSGLAVGRTRNLLNPFILTISILVLLFIIIIIYMRHRIIAILRKRKFKRKNR